MGACELLADQRERGLDTETAMLVVIDEAKALHKGVRGVFEVARKQLGAELREVIPPRDPEKETDRLPPPTFTETPPRRFYGTVQLDPTRVGRDASAKTGLSRSFRRERR